MALCACMRARAKNSTHVASLHWCLPACMQLGGGHLVLCGQAVDGAARPPCRVLCHLPSRAAAPHRGAPAVVHHAHAVRPAGHHARGGGEAWGMGHRTYMRACGQGRCPTLAWPDLGLAWPLPGLTCAACKHTQPEARRRMHGTARTATAGRRRESFGGKSRHSHAGRARPSHVCAGALRACVCVRACPHVCAHACVPATGRDALPGGAA